MSVIELLALVWLLAGILAVLILWRACIAPMSAEDERYSRMDVELDERERAARRPR